jgi:calcineurin-like phosphoesterase family protein
MIYFSSDLHFCHDKPFIYESRGFRNIQEHDETLVERFNSVVKPDDTLYLLGDILMGGDVNQAKQYFLRLNGKKIIILGNHDSEKKIAAYEEAAEKIVYADQIKCGKRYFYLSHYPTLVNNQDIYPKVVNLCGHTHTRNRWENADMGCYHVEVDAHFCYPVSLDEIREEFQIRTMVKTK